VEQRGRFSKEELMTGDIVRFITGMGGGYGDPMKRDPQAVLDDVLDGYITPEIARKVYGVAVVGDPAGIDEAETRRLRE
ncbi:hydantoinase B/oxoprolinase family protein, partial [Candidatus Bipolaricaulota bacterium]|nr:hydantoinase B/oxoprolinase family protein [Candidatus Bipolaricaulota bacterium]